ncbi:hypothetical protein NE237_017480 [Protea cynaroides]|uniref:Uncharacterized protein n=1 Tax=Protea cynaroides TaxID=273540 RepID=A0A9Q0K858_9MAGN|nr:hypothetical protein NE237_017480 [Protea cynaroides]
MTVALARPVPSPLLAPLKTPLPLCRQGKETFLFLRCYVIPLQDRCDCGKRDHKPQIPSTPQHDSLQVESSSSESALLEDSVKMRPNISFGSLSQASITVIQCKSAIET